MKHQILVLMILIGSICRGQVVAPVVVVAPLAVAVTPVATPVVAVVEHPVISIPSPTFTAGLGITTFKTYSGYQKSNTVDTVEIYLLVSSINGYLAEPSAMLYGFATRRLMIFKGDAMPPTSYDPYWEIEYYLDYQKKKFSNNVIIWQTKLKGI